MQKPDFSLVLPVYNTEAYLTLFLEGLGAPAVPLEIIVVNDGSPGDTLAVVEAHGSRLPGLRYIDLGSNYGPVEARRRGALAAAGRFVHFVDPDDWVEPEVYPRLLAVLEETGSDLLIGGVTVWKDDQPESAKNSFWSAPDGPLGEAWLLDFLANRTSHNVFRVVAERSLVIQAFEGLGDAGHLTAGEDYLILLAAFLHAKHPWGWSQVLYNYRLGIGISSSHHSSAERWLKSFVDKRKVLAGSRALLRRHRKGRTARLAFQEYARLESSWRYQTWLALDPEQRRKAEALLRSRWLWSRWQAVMRSQEKARNYQNSRG